MTPPARACVAALGVVAVRLGDRAFPALAGIFVVAGCVVLRAGR